MVEVPVKMYMQNLAKKAREIVKPMALLATPIKNKALQAMADRRWPRGCAGWPICPIRSAR